MKVVVAIDSFKHSLSAREAAEAVTEGVRLRRADAEVVVLPISDGGEGAGALLVEALGGRSVGVEVHDALMRPIEARYGLLSGRRAVVELAQASGIEHLTASERNPLVTTTFGVGELIMAALQGGAREVYVTLGGSATNDGGMGLLSALGFRFLDASGAELAGRGAELGSVARVDASGVSPLVREARFVVAVDVSAPMLGPTGAAQLFARQKGADDDMVALLERGMESYAAVIEDFAGRGVAYLEGSGAAGCVAAGLVALLGAQMRGGADMVLDAVGFDDHLAGADLVITGEGRMDRQTALGKAPSVVARRARLRGVRCVALCGAAEWRDELREVGFERVVAATPEDMPLAEAMVPATAYDLLRRAAAELEI